MRPRRRVRRGGERRRERLSARRALERHVREVQRAVRTCAGCGQCCTEAYNAAKILPLEGMRIARHLESLPGPRREALLERVKQAVERYRLCPSGPKIRYTCPFLEPHLGCALPIHVKPTVCLSFNPVDPDRCEQEPEWYFPAHDAEEKDNLQAGLPSVETPLPVAVLAALPEEPSLIRTGSLPSGPDPRARTSRNPSSAREYRRRTPPR